MNNKNKKNIIQIILIAAIAFFIAGNILPINDFSYSEMLEETGSENTIGLDDFEVKYYFVAYYWSVRDDTFSEITGGPNIMSKWVILHLFDYTSTEGQSDDIVYNYVQTKSGIKDLQNTAVFFIGLPLFILIVASVFFALVSLKNIDKKYSKASLYAGICYLIPIIMFVGLVNSYFAIPDGVGNGKYINYLNYNLGFYYSVVSVILYFAAFFMQRYVEYPKKFFENKDFQQVDLPAE